MNELFRLSDAHAGDINCVKFNPTGDLLATASDDCTIKLWKVLG